MKESRYFTVSIYDEFIFVFIKFPKINHENKTITTHYYTTFNNES